MSMFKKLHSFHALIIASMLLTSCLPTGNVSGRRVLSSLKSTTTNGKSSSGNGAVADTTTTDSTTISSQTVELTHLVDPFTGTYKKKITIPKNYHGYLYISGLNLSVLNSKIIKVRLNFGLDGQSVVLGATPAVAPGIIPKTQTQVLVLDLSKAPFQDMRLPYDLYDYTDYNSDSTLEPVTNNLDSGLYCRGLKLADDPTFIPANDTATCSLGSDKCLYAYAKIADNTFFTASNITSTPVRPAIWSGTTTLSSTFVNGMCLPDYSRVSYDAYLAAYLPSGLTYQGPYRPVTPTGSWGITDSAIFASATSGTTTSYYGLFETGSAGDRTTWYRSLMFPRAGVVSINTGNNYLGHATKFSDRQLLSSGTSGYTQYMDGCNIRAQNYDASTNEGIGSCTVVASVEVFYMKGTSEVSITKSNSIKIQLTRASILNTTGKEVLGSSFKTCESSASCGADECCYNSRCWSKDLVSQCVDESGATGNRENGTSCTSDYQCGSLCCNSSTGTCAPHSTTGSTPILCSKQAGQACVSQEFCAKEAVGVCKLYKTGTNTDGTVKCEVRCTPVETYGSCVGGYCVAPVSQTTSNTSFDTVNCTGAIDP